MIKFICFALGLMMCFGNSTQTLAYGDNNPILGTELVAPQQDVVKLMCSKTWQLDEDTYALLYEEYLEHNPKPDNPPLAAIKQVLSVVCMTKFKFFPNGQVVVIDSNGKETKDIWKLSKDGKHLTFGTGSEVKTYEFEIDEEHFILHDIESSETDDVFAQFLVLKAA